MLSIYAESLFVAIRQDAPRRHPTPPLSAQPGWLARLLFGRG